MTWIVETRIPKIPGMPREPWQRFALAQSRDQARGVAHIPRAQGYLTRVRQVEESRRWAQERGLA